jgi:hypothetical protein
MSVDLTGGISLERERMFASRPEGEGIRDAVNVWIEESNAAFAMRIGVEAVSDEWNRHQVWLDIAFSDGRVLLVREHFASHSPIDADGQPTVLGSGPLRFRCVEPFGKWSVSFDGQALETTATDLIQGSLPPDLSSRPVSFEIDMEMAAPPWQPGSLVKEAGDALEGEQGEFMSPRYEQLFRTKGTMRIADQRLDFTGNGLRIRRQGFRKFEGFWGHCWQSALFPSGKAFGCNIYPPREDGASNYNEGFVFTGDGGLQPAQVVEAPWLRRLTASGDDVTVVLRTPDGRILTIEGETFVNTRSLGDKVLPADFPIVQQAHARYRWDGEATVGMVERSTLPSQMEG